MAIIVSIADQGSRIELINLEGRMITFTDRPDGCYYLIQDICGTRIEGKASSMKSARYSAIELLEKRGHRSLAQMLHLDYKPEKKDMRAYLPCPMILTQTAA